MQRPTELSRRELIAGTAGALLTSGVAAPTRRAWGDAPPAAPIVKPLPPEWFTILGTNAEMRWEAMQGQGYLTPWERFFVRNHTSTPRIDQRTWQLQVFGSGLRRPEGISLSYRDL